MGGRHGLTVGGFMTFTLRPCQQEAVDAVEGGGGGEPDNGKLDNVGATKEAEPVEMEFE